MGFILENLSGFSTLNGCHAAPDFLPRLLMLARLSSLTVCARSGIKECGQLLCVALKRFILQNINDGCVRPMEFYIDRRKIVLTHRLSILRSAAYFTRVWRGSTRMRRFQSTNEILPCVRVTAVAMPVVDKCWPKLVIKNSTVGWQRKHQDDHITADWK